MSMKIILCLLLSGFALSSASKSYEGAKVYDVYAKNPIEKGILLNLSLYPGYDFFDMPRAFDKPARIMVELKDQPTFEGLLEQYKIPYTVVDDNLAESLEANRLNNEQMQNQRALTRGISFNVFHRFSAINAYLDELAQKYPSRVSVRKVGQSYEKRDIKTITITNGDGRANKNVIFLDAGIHAREWIAPAEALYVIYQLAENFAANAALLKDYDWVILPVVNPDGYEYTHTSSRMWRKTRKPVTNTCTGTDANRNFDFHWGEVGASTFSCADTYRGQTAFSEPETQIVRNLLQSLKGCGKFYLTLHSYGNYLLYPWGWTSSLPDTWRNNDEVAQAGAAAISAATGTKYTVGSSTNVLYAAAGGSDDYAFGAAGFPVSITMELPAGGSGFDPSPSQIQPFVSETWIGIKAMAEKVIQKF